MLRSTLLAASRSSSARNMVQRVPMARSIVDRFVAGADTEHAVRTAAGICTDRLVSLDHLGEDTTDHTQARHTVRAYQDVLATLAEYGLAARAEVSLKLSALGAALPGDGTRIALEHARKVCAAARRAGTTVTIDAEDHTTTEETLSIVADLRADFPETGAVLQACLRRTESDCADLTATGARVRLCKGAYDEPEQVAFQRKADVDAAYVRCLRILMRGSGYPMVATHDQRLIEIAERIAGDAGRSASDYEFQMLLGVRHGAQRELAARGQRVRVYVPYGTDWYPYFMRRLGERPANLAFFAKALLQKN